MSNFKMTENTFTTLPLLMKIFAVILGAIFALTMTGDIDSDGKLKLSFGVMVKFSFSAFLGFIGGDFVINLWGLQDWSYSAHGLIMMMISVFGMLFVGIVYQSILLTARGKKLSEIILEIKEVFKAIIK